MIHIFIEDIVFQKTYEVCVSAQLSFFDILCHFRDTDACRNMIVYEKCQKQICDADVSLNMLNVIDGMLFVVV